MILIHCVASSRCQPLKVEGVQFRGKAAGSERTVEEKTADAKKLQVNG